MRQRGHPMGSGWLNGPMYWQPVLTAGEVIEQDAGLAVHCFREMKRVRETF